MDRAYHDSAHDSSTRVHQSRRHRPSSSSPREDDTFLRGAATRTSEKSESSAQGKNNMSERDGRRLRDRRYDDDDRYHSRSRYPPSSLASEPVSRPPPHSTLRKRHSWPPQPFAEDERASLRRESNARQLLKEVNDSETTPSRGTVDQDPLIIDVPEFINQHERRFVLAHRDAKPSDTGIPTPPTSEDERYRKARRKPSRLNIGDPDSSVPELSKRTASPYAYSKSTKQQDDLLSATERPSVSGTPAPYASRAPATKNDRLSAGQPLSSPRRDAVRLSPRSRQGNDYFSAEHADNDLAIDDDDYEGKNLPAKGKKPANGPTSERQGVSAVDFASASSNAPIRKHHLDARRNTDSQDSLPTLGRLNNMDKSRRPPMPLVGSSSLSEARDARPISSYASLDPRAAEMHPRSRESSYSSSRPVSPNGSIGQATPPPRSPGRSTETSRESSVWPPSVPSSRPSSPSPRTPLESPRLAKTDMDWSALLAANAARRTKPASRLGAPVARDEAPNQLRRSMPPGPSSTANSLPYPEDSSLMGSAVLMPEERDHAYQHEKTIAQSPSYLDEAQKFPSSASSTTTPTSTQFPPSSSSTTARPTLQRGHSASSTSPVETRFSDSRSRFGELKRTESFASSSETRKELASLMKKGMPPCSRPDLVAGYDDWYTVIGATNLDFCPDCIDTLFERTVFRPHFRRSLPRNLHTKIRCAFGSPWTRLAWLLTLQQQRTDLRLLKDLAEIEDTTEPCPGHVEAAHSWYGLRDPDGLFVRDFHVCFGDVRKIERLLPTLAGLFVKLPQRASSSSSEKRTCAMRAPSNRFSAYLDALVSTHEKALASRQGADPMPLIELVEHKTRLRECTRDNMLRGALWHVAPEIVGPTVPALTVCADCFEAVVATPLRQGAAVAKKFSRTLQPVPHEGIGSSCQLYSPRMRRAFQRALDDNDPKPLVRKALERRDAELRLQDRYADVMRRAKRLEDLTAAAAASAEIDVEEEERRLNRELEKISMEWKTKWE